jgi:glycosyltransferase involved in cell wall biosynthesis
MEQRRPSIVVDWFSARLGMDGFVDYATRLVRGLAAHADIRVAVPDDDAWDAAPVADVARIDLVPGERVVRGTRTATTAAWYDEALPDLLDGFAAAGERPDAVLATAFFIPSRSPSPVAVTVHDLAFVRHPDAFSDENRALYVGRGRPSAERAAAVVAVSRSTAADVVDLWGVDASRVVATPLGPTIPPLAGGPGDDPDALAAEREAARSRAAARLGLPGRFLLVVSPTHRRKNLPLVVGEHRRLPAELRRELPLVLANADDPFTRAMLDDLDADEVVATGRLPEDELRDLVVGATALLHGSSSEGFGLPALNAMLVGTPLIANDAPALDEVGAGAARFVDIHEPGDMARAIREVATDDRLAGALGAAGIARAGEFSWASTAERTARTLIDVAAGRAPGLSIAREAAA